jgi:hypothetical protein
MYIYNKKSFVFLNIFFLYYFLQKKESPSTSDDQSSSDSDTDVYVTVAPSKPSDCVPTIVIDSLSNDHDLTVTPAFPNFPTDEEVVMEPATVVLVESVNNVSEPESNSKASPQASQLLDELKYLLKPTNSLARTEDSVQASVRIKYEI